MNYKSQYSQDKFLNENIFKNRRDGVYVDIGAHNGVSLSNTYFFEKELSWKGICFEPIPKAFSELQKNRTSININGCAWNKNEKKNFRMINGYSEMLSGIVDSYDERHIDRIKRECDIHNITYTDFEVECFELNSVLEAHNFFNINLLSIDTEGSEDIILKSIDYRKFNIDVILMENNYKNNEIREFLTNNGYNLYKSLSIDDLFIKSNLFSSEL